MKDSLVRFGVAIEGSLLRELDVLVKERGGTRSELFRDLGRAAVGRAKVPKGVDAMGALTLVYDHHVRDLSERLTEIQHQLGDGVRSAMHVHLSHDLCLEVVILKGKSDQLQVIADRILAMRGVKQGGIELVVAAADESHAHAHAHAHAHEHTQGHSPEAEAATAPSSAYARTRGGRRAPGKNSSPESLPRRPRQGRSRRG